MRVIKGPGAVSYGPQTIAGAIDLVTRPAPATPQAAVDLAGGSYGYKKVHAYAGLGGENHGVLLEAVHLEDSGFKRLLDDRDTGSQRNELMLKGRYRLEAPGFDHHLGIKLGYANEASNETYLGLSEADFAVDPNQRYAPSQQDRMEWNRTSITLSDTIDLTDEMSLTTTLYRHDLDRTWRKVNGFRGASLYDALIRPQDPRNQVYVSILQGDYDSSNSDEAILIGPNQRGFVSQGIESRLQGAFDTGPVSHRIEAGARLHYDRIRRRHSQDGYAVLGDQLQPEPVVSDLFEDNEGFTVAGAFLATDAVTFADLTLTPGLRVEVLRSVHRDFKIGTEEVNRTTAFLPGIAAYYAVWEGLGVLAGVHRGFSPPVPSGGDGLDPSVPRPAPTKKAEPELSVNYEAGARYTRGRSRLEVIGFFNDYSNLTDICTFSSGCNGTNVDAQFSAGAAQIWGLEASGDYRPTVGAFQLPLSFAYTFTQSSFRSDFESDDPVFGSVRAGDELPYVPRHQLNATVGLDHDFFGLVGSVNYLAATREEAGNEPLDQVVATGELFTVDVSAEVRPWSFLEIYVNARNLFDNQVVVSHRPFGARPNAPRWVQVGLRVAAF
jgi:Fe(3+) dicitrate transport protein